MKLLKFRKNLVPLVLSGEKTSTWRLFDDKDLSVGDAIELREFGSDVSFATARIYRVKVLTFAELSDSDKQGHEGYTDDEEMYEVYSGYYKQPVGPHTMLKILWFDQVAVI